METIKNENILEELKNLQVGQKLFIAISSDISNTIQLLSLKCKSYENLFQSYINNTNEEASAMNVDIFLKKYTEAFTQIELLKERMLKEYLGKAYQYFISNVFNYDFNYQLNVLEIVKQETQRRIK
ncbi:MAG: hypothetical protein ACI8WT_002806 [Clostridium sp.]|jgi:hypothetical protein